MHRRRALCCRRRRTRRRCRRPSRRSSLGASRRRWPRSGGGATTPTQRPCTRPSMYGAGGRAASSYPPLTLFPVSPVSCVRARARAEPYGGPGGRDGGPHYALRGRHGRVPPSCRPAAACARTGAAASARSTASSSVAGCGQGPPTTPGPAAAARSPRRVCAWSHARAWTLQCARASVPRGPDRGDLRRRERAGPRRFFCTARGAAADQPAPPPRRHHIRRGRQLPQVARPVPCRPTRTPALPICPSRRLAKKRRWVGRVQTKASLPYDFGALRSWYRTLPAERQGTPRPRQALTGRRRTGDSPSSFALPCDQAASSSCWRTFTRLTRLPLPTLSRSAGIARAPRQR